jgi:hypothetical protein
MINFDVMGEGEVRIQFQDTSSACHTIWVHQMKSGDQQQSESRPVRISQTRQCPSLPEVAKSSAELPWNDNRNEGTLLSILRQALMDATAVVVKSPPNGNCRPHTSSIVTLLCPKMGTTWNIPRWMRVPDLRTFCAPCDFLWPEGNSFTRLPASTSQR